MTIAHPRLSLLAFALLGCAVGNGSSSSDDGSGPGADIGLIIAADVAGTTDASDAGPDAATEPPPGERVFDLGLLHEIDIVVEATYLDALENDRENRVPCMFTFDGETLPMTGIRQKGGLGSSSSLSGKPGFSVKLNEFVVGQRLDGMEKILLNNAQEDPTFVSEHVGYEMHRRVGLWAPRTSHGVVTLNGQVYGIYVLKEAISEDFLARNFGEANDAGNLYEGYYHAADQSLGDFVTHTEELDLKDEVEDMRTRDDVIALVAAVAGASDAEFEAMVGQRLDLDAYITQLAMDSLLGYWDSYHYFLNNYYLYDNPADGRFVYVPQGMDQLQYSNFDAGAWPMGVLAQRVRAIPALDARFASEKARILADVWDVPAIHARIDQVGSVLHSTTRTDSAVLNNTASYDAYAQGVKDSFAARLP